MDKCHQHKKSNIYSNKRKEAQDVSKQVANHFKQSFEQDKKSIHEWIDFNTVLVHRWQAHKKGLTKIRIMGEGN
jgi:predicted nuclease of restriction endonuclease-like RecB superfamily